MMPSLIQMFSFFGVFARQALGSGPTSIFINKMLPLRLVAEYSLLETCAELQLSTIVRNMEYGCGDDSKLTSFACFCYQSSAKFSSMIGAHVSSACNPQYPAQNTTAIEVFSSYCQQGQVALTSASISSTPSPSISPSSSVAPASGPVTVSVTATPSTIPEPASQTKKTNVAAIAAGVIVPIVAIALGIAGFFLWQRKKKSPERIELAAHESGPDIHELKNAIEPVEIAGDARRAELSPNADAHELYSGRGEKN